jgi:hypothetical protein
LEGLNVEYLILPSVKDVAAYCVNLFENVCETLESKMNDGAFNRTFMKSLMKEAGFLASTN